MRRKAIAFYLFILFLVIVGIEVTPLKDANRLAIEYIMNFIKDTSADSAVTAIYLNYRVFDTLFEALLLLISVIGIIHFSRHEGDY